jgi:hypothetical protein
MMQMLEAGGIPAFTDGTRTADGDNPRGYFEWEAIKKIGQDHRVLDQAVASEKAIKVISTLLPKLPKAHQYKVLFMERDISEVVRSQQKMLENRGEPAEPESAAETGKRLKAHNDQVLSWMHTAPHIDALMVSHRGLIKNPAKSISKVVAFLGQERLPTSEVMASAIHPNLYRNRRASGLFSKLNLLRR